MKLLIIYHAGLAEDSKNIFREYARQGVDLSVIVPMETRSSTGQIFKYSHKDSEKSYRFIPVAYGLGFKLLPLFFAIRKIKPDVIHVFDEYSSIYLAKTILCRNVLYGNPLSKATFWPRKKVPVFAYAFQNISFTSPPFIFEFSIKLVKRIIYKIFYPLLFWYHRKNVSGVSGSNSEALLNIKNINKKIAVRLIFWGVDLKKFFEKNRNACREKLGIKKEIKFLGYAGRLIAEKGLDDLIYTIVKTDYCLMLVGDGDHKNRLVKIVDDLNLKNRIFFYKNVKHGELVDFYNAMDILVLPSKTVPQWKEQYGRVLVEAMACGLPVIGSSSGAIKEVLLGYPKGLIFKEGDVDDLVEKIKNISDLKLKENFNLANFLYKFSVENFVLEHLKFYWEFLKI